MEVEKTSFPNVDGDDLQGFEENKSKKLPLSFGAALSFASLRLKASFKL